MDRAQLKAGFFFVVSVNGEIPGLDSWVGAVKRWAFSNPNKKAFLQGPKRVFEKRSNQQCRTVMGLYMDQILEELGYESTDKDFLFQTLKLEMGWTEERVNKRTRAITLVPKKTRDLPTPEFSAFMEKFVRHMAIHHNIVLPDPVADMARI